MRDFIDRHHLLPESQWWLALPGNIIHIRRKLHNAVHMLMDNRTPMGQIRFIRDFNSSVLSHEVHKDIMKLLDKYSWWNEIYAYKNWLFIPEHLLRWQWKYK